MCVLFNELRPETRCYTFCYKYFTFYVLPFLGCKNIRRFRPDRKRCLIKSEKFDSRIKWKVSILVFFSFFSPAYCTSEIIRNHFARDRFLIFVKSSISETIYQLENLANNMKYFEK